MLEATTPAPAAELPIVETAAEAFARYRQAYDNGGLIQNAWHETGDDGRHLACGLGILGGNVTGPKDCPAQVMPLWLAQMVPHFFDNQPFDDAKAWGLSFYEQLQRLDGEIPFSVVHDWRANVACVMNIEWLEARSLDTAKEKAVQALHLRALQGDTAPEAEWKDALQAAYAYAYASASASAYASAYASASAEEREAAIKRLSAGMVECLSRVVKAEGQGGPAGS